MLMHEKPCLIPIITSHGGTVALSYIQTEKKCNRGTALNRLAETSTGGGGGGGGGKLVLLNRTLALNSDVTHNYEYAFGP